MSADNKGIRFLVLTLLSSGAALGATEIGLRVGGAGDDRAPDATGDGRISVLRFSDDETLIYELEPLARARAWDTDVAVNSAGFRDREFEPARREGVARIVALGDSITFGNGIPLADTWPKRLERLLLDAGRPTEVLNLGVGGYDTLQEAVMLERIGLRYAPDEVVVCFCMNDVGQFSISAIHLERLARAGNPLQGLRLWRLLTRTGASSGERLADLANEEERYRHDNRGRMASLAGDEPLAALMDALAAVLARHAPLPPAVERDQRFLPLYTSPSHLGRLRFGLERLARLRDEHRFDLLLVLVPHLRPAPLAEGWELAHRIVGHEAERVGISFCTVVDEFAAEGFERLNLDNGPVHPSARGHELIAGKVLTSLGE